MECRQCGGSNQDRAIECGWCGGVLRRPYPYDPIGKWLEGINQKHQATPESAGSLLPVVALLVGLPLAAAVTASVFGLVTGWLAATALGLGVVGLIGGVAFLSDRWTTRDGRAHFQDQIWPEIDGFRRQSNIEPWRMTVVVAETFPERSFLRCHLLTRESR